jgi:hypothetical protein
MDIVKLIAIYVVIITVFVGVAIYLPKKVKEHDEALVAKTTEVIIKNKILGECLAEDQYRSLLVKANADSTYWVKRYKESREKEVDSLLLFIRKNEEEAYRLKRKAGWIKDGNDGTAKHSN